MITFVVVALLALLAFAYVALPLLSPDHADPLPDDADPVLAGLQEEKTALLRAIAELDLRQDLAAERREQLRRRYEAKAAAAIKAIDARQAELAARRRRAGAPAGGAAAAAAQAAGSEAPGSATRVVDGEAPAPPGPARRRRAPVAAITLLGLGVLAAAFLPSYVLPRVGVDATVTTTDVEAARQIRDLRRAADREPSAANLMALGDAYLAVGQVEDAQAAFARAAEADDATLPVFQRLAVLALQTDLAESQVWLERAAAAAPGDAETLFLLSEVAYANGDMPTSEAALREYVRVLGGAPNEAVTARLELFERVGELTAAAEAEPTPENLMALADLYWRGGDLRGATSAYLRVLTETGTQPPLALSRMGETMLRSGAAGDAAALIERAAAASDGVEGLEPSAQLALGEAYVRLGRFGEAVAVLEAYQGDDPVAAELLAAARAGGTPGDAGGLSAVADESGLGAAVFAASCAECHGPTGAGGMGVALAGNARAANEGNVRDAVTFGRGMMPGFGAVLDPEELDAVVAYVVEVVSRR